MKIFAQVKKYREIKGYSQENMAMDLGLSQSQYSRRENGIIQFTTKELIAIAEMLDVDFSTLIQKENKHPDSKFQFSDEQKVDDLTRLVLLLIDVLISHENNTIEKNKLVLLLLGKLKNL
ncbi:MAG: Helix-turn-helix domain [Bacteroidota bacterium]|jgi:transcriptional regulator with XRE-family HTH domain